MVVLLRYICARGVTMTYCRFCLAASLLAILSSCSSNNAVTPLDSGGPDPLDAGMPSVTALPAGHRTAEVGDNLDPEGVLNLNHMESVGSTTDVRVFAGYDIDPALVSGNVSGIDMVHFIKVVHDSNVDAINVGGDPANQSFPRAGYNSADP